MNSLPLMKKDYKSSQKTIVGMMAIMLALSIPVQSQAANQSVNDLQLEKSPSVSESVTQHPLQAYVNRLKTFSAAFEQRVPESDLYEAPKQSGYFELNRPGQLVWQYTDPVGQKILVDGENLWVYDEDLEQVTVRPLAEVQADIPLSWLLFNEKIEDKFEILSAGQRNGADWYNLTPKAATYFQSIEVALRNGEMVEVWMYEGADTVTKVTFSKIVSNQPIPQKNFQLLVPKGTDVIGEPR